MARYGSTILELTEIMLGFSTLQLQHQVADKAAELEDAAVAVEQGYAPNEAARQEWARGVGLLSSVAGASRPPRDPSHFRVDLRRPRASPMHSPRWPGRCPGPVDPLRVLHFVDLL